MEKPGTEGEEKVFLNGEIVPASKAFIPVLDRSVLYGDAVFETVRAYKGRPFRLERHLERLKSSCALLRLDLPVSFDELSGAVMQLIMENGLYDSNRDAYVRITVTGGESHGKLGLEREGKPNIFVVARKYRHAVEPYEKGIRLVVSGIRRNSTSPLSRLKTANYMESLLARQEALDRGADDALFLTTMGNIAEASAANVFIVRERAVLTPDVGCGLLPGITRETVIEICAEMGLEPRAVTAGLELIEDAHELFLTNSLVEVLPVREVEGRRIGSECPGRITKAVHQAYRNRVRQELGIDI